MDGKKLWKKRGTKINLQKGQKNGRRGVNDIRKEK
jgi:hypothetical protein